MSKLLTAALVSGAMVVPAVAGAQTFPDPAGYGNRGQCESAVSQARNEVRQETTAGETNPNAGEARREVNQEAKDWQCVEEAGRWYVRVPSEPPTTDAVTEEPLREPATTEPATPQSTPPDATPPAPQSPPETAPPQ